MTTGDTRSRLRLVVIQALVFSLFATLLVRLYYLQVVGGEHYAEQAASQSLREVVVQPQRGLIVDDMGRPLVANRTSWVVSIDRGTLAKLSEDEQRALLRPRLAASSTSRSPGSAGCSPPAATTRAWRATAGTARRSSRCPVAVDVPQPIALRVLEQPEDFPARDRRAAEPARLPAAVRHQPGARARLPQPDHRRRATTMREDGRRPSVNGASVGRPGRRREAVRRVAARDARLQRRSRSTRWAG